MRQSLGRETSEDGGGTGIRAAEEDTYIIAYKQDAANDKKGERFMYRLLYKFPSTFLKQKIRRLVVYRTGQSVEWIFYV